MESGSNLIRDFSLGRHIHSAIGIFSSNDYNGAYQLIRRLSLDSNNVFGRSLVVEVNDDEVEIPVIARRHFEELIFEDLTHPGTMKTKKIILPLYNNAEDINRRAFNSTLSEWFACTSYGTRLRKIITGKGDVYYGGKGIIFDESYTPLLLCTLTAKKVPEDIGNIMVYYRSVCHVSPKVFIEPDKLVNKGIIKRLIPCYTTEDINFPTSKSSFRSNPENRKVKVIVDNFDKFFIKPVKPTPSTCSDDALNKCLIDNIDDIMRLI